MKEQISKIKPYILIIIVVVLIRTFIITPGIVSGSSMEETLYDKEWVIINKIGLIKDLERFEIVVIKYENETIIKRIIGLPGETVEYGDNILYVNGKEIKIPFEFEDTDDFIMKAKDNEYIVLGDNRDISKDSRSVGPIDKKNIIGKVKLVFFPLKKIRIVN